MKGQKPVKLTGSTKIVVSDGKHLPPIGSELHHAHQLFLRLRSVGIAEEDLIRINDKMEPEYFECLLAMSRGLMETKLPDNIVNLQVRGWTGFPVKENLTIIRDDRLGMQIFRKCDGLHFLGDMQIKAAHASGTCLQNEGKVFDDRGLKLNFVLKPVERHVNLTHAAAEWIARNEPDVARAMLQGKESSKVIFLGTVWRVLEHQYKPNEGMSPISATAIWIEEDPTKDYSETGIGCGRVVLPQGDWPSDWLVAILA